MRKLCRFLDYACHSFNENIVILETRYFNTHAVSSGKDKLHH